MGCLSNRRVAALFRHRRATGSSNARKATPSEQVDDVMSELAAADEIEENVDAVVQDL